MKTWLVTGASGFVGGALASRLLKMGDRVVTILRDGCEPLGCEVIRGDVTDLGSVRRALARREFDGVFHLAAHAKVEECARDPLGTWESNVRGTYTLLEAARDYPRLPVVVATSDHAYGKHSVGDPPSKEDDPFVSGGGYYDVSKSCADMIAMCYGGQGLDVRVVRCGNIYGPGDMDRSRLIPSLINNLLDGDDLLIRSDGTPVREFIHIDDAVEGYLAVMHRGRERAAYNIAAGAYPVMYIAEIVRMAGWNQDLGNPDITVAGTRLGEINQILLDTTRAREELGWSPQVRLLDGISSTLDWWRLRHVKKTTVVRD